MIKIIIFILIILCYVSFILYKYFKNNIIENSIKKNETFETNHNMIIKKEEPKIRMVIKHKNLHDYVLIKLYDSIVPLTCKNFRYIIKNGIKSNKYHNSIFHRVIKDFMIQGGDIINKNGTGSISLYGDTFEDENFKIKHNKPGLLSMANSGPNTNGCQFFITTVPTPHLDGKHVVFGEIYQNMDFIYQLQNVEVDSNDRPINPIFITEINEII